MKGITIGEQCHVINALLPQDVTGGVKTSDYWNMKNYAHATIIITTGSVTDDYKVTLYESADSGGASKNLKAFDYYYETTAAGDTLTTRTAVTVAATGFQTGTNNTTTFVIEVDASELTDGYPYMALLLDNAGNAFISVVVVLSGSRHQGDPATESPTAIT